MERTGEIVASPCAGRRSGASARASPLRAGRPLCVRRRPAHRPPAVRARAAELRAVGDVQLAVRAWADCPGRSRGATTSGTRSRTASSRRTMRSWRRPRASRPEGRRRRYRCRRRRCRWAWGWPCWGCAGVGEAGCAELPQCVGACLWRRPIHRGALGLGQVLWASLRRLASGHRSGEDGKDQAPPKVARWGALSATSLLHMGCASRPAQWREGPVTAKPLRR